jgi:hypothetical protein
MIRIFRSAKAVIVSGEVKRRSAKLATRERLMNKIGSVTFTASTSLRIKVYYAIRHKK